MKSVKIVAIGCLCLAMLSGFPSERWTTSSAPLWAQETPPPAAKVRKKPRGRLPNYYSQVVDEEQREAIYKIQSNYTEQIAKLQQQIDALIADRKAEVEKVLTAEQKTRVAEITADALKRRADAKTKAGEAKKPTP